MDDIKAVEKTVLDINDIDWNGMWNKTLQKMPRENEKNRWNKIAPQFNKWMKTDEYPLNFAEKVHKKSDYTVLDLGCGNGSVTLEVAKYVKQVTAVDISEEMLKLVQKNAAANGISNIEYIQSSIEDIDVNEIGQYDVVIASRSLGNIKNLQKELKKIDHIAKKYVYMTHWSATGNQLEKDLCKVTGITHYPHPDYIYVCNMLYQMDIYANLEPINCSSRHVYRDLNDAVARHMWKLGWTANNIKKEKRMEIEDYLKKKLVKIENGTLEYTTTNPSWMLLWWEKGNHH